MSTDGYPSAVPLRRKRRSPAQIACNSINPDHVAQDFLRNSDDHAAVSTTEFSEPIAKTAASNPDHIGRTEIHRAGLMIETGLDDGHRHAKLSPRLAINGRIDSDAEQEPRQGTRSAIVIIHQREFVRDCFVRCLEISYRHHAILAYESIVAWNAAKEYGTLSPAVIICFVDGPNSSSMADLERLECFASSTPTIIMSDVDDVYHVTRAFQGGARGYIPTNLPYKVVMEAVRLVEAGGTFVPVSSLALHRDELETRRNGLLTAQQLRVVEALCQGMANKQIAYKLNMSEHTVKVHLRHIMRKLNVKSRTEVVVLSKDLL